MRQGALPKIILAVYLVVLMLPIYWLINMSLRTNSDIVSGMALWPHNPTLEKYFQIFNDPDLGARLRRLAHLCRDQHRHFGRGRAAGGLRVQPLRLHRRQAPVLLAPDQSDGADRGLRHAVLQSLLCGRPVRHRVGGRARPLPVQYSARGLDSRGVRRRRAARDRRDGGDRRLFVSAILHPDLPALDRERHRRDGILLLHVLVGRAIAGDDADRDQRPRPSRRS